MMMETLHKKNDTCLYDTKYFYSNGQTLICFVILKMNLKSYNICFMTFPTKANKPYFFGYFL